MIPKAFYVYMAMFATLMAIAYALTFLQDANAMSLKAPRYDLKPKHISLKPLRILVKPLCLKTKSQTISPCECPDNSHWEESPKFCVKDKNAEI